MLNINNYSKEKQEEIKQLKIIPVGRAKDLTDKKFSRLTVIGRCERNFRGAYWWCICDCEEHNIIQVSASHLTCNQAKSCGCLNKEIVAKIGQSTKENLIGQHFGKLTVIKDSGKRSHNRGVIWTCKCECGNFIDVRADALKSKKYVSCGCQKTSCGEEKIQNFLELNKINYIKEYCFSGFHIDNDVRSNPRFDFYLPEYNCCIEFDGQQHFQAVPNWGGEKVLEKIQYRDQQKNNYCKNNGIKLIRIPYTQINEIENILKEKLKREA